MTTHFENFDALTVGQSAAAAAGWANLIGTSMSAFATPSPGDGDKSIGALVTGDAIGYTGLGITSTQGIKAEVYVLSGARARAIVRADSSGQNYYECFIATGSSAFTIRRRIAGVDQAAFAVTGVSASSLVANTLYYLEFRATGVSPTTLQARLYPAASTPPAWEATASDASGTLPTGYPGVKGEASSTPNSYFGRVTVDLGVIIGAVTLSNQATTTLTVTAPAPTLGTGPYTIQNQRANDVSGAPGTFANIGAASASLTYNDSGLSLGTTAYWWRAVVTDSTGDVFYGPSVTTGGPVQAGVASLQFVSDGVANISTTAPRGGGAALTQQWYRGLTNTTVTTLVPGATGLTLNDTGLSNNVQYFYKARFTDGTTTADSNIVVAIPNNKTHFENFESAVAGTPLSNLDGWENSIGNSMQVVALAGTLTPPNAVMAGINGDSAIYTKMGLGTDTFVRASVNFSSVNSIHARVNARSDKAANFYECFVTAGSNAFSIRKRLAGSDQPAMVVTGTSATTPVAGQNYFLEFQVIGNSPVTLQARLYLATGPVPAWEGTATDSSASPILSGYPGIRGENSLAISYFDSFTATYPLSASGVAFSNVAGTTLTVTASAATSGVAPYTYQMQRSNDVSGAPGTFSNVGPSSSSLSYNDSGLSLVSNIVWYRVITTDAIGNTSISPYSSIGGAVKVGTVSIGSTASGSITMTATPAIGGAATVINQWYAGSDPTSVTTLVPGATGLTMTEAGLLNGVLRFYQLVCTDGVTTSTSAIIAATPGRTLYVGLIGHSWNVVTCSATPGSIGGVSSQAIGNLLQKSLEALYTDGTKVVVVNMGVGGSMTSGWLPGTPNMNAAIAAFNAAHAVPGDWIVHSQLDINDQNILNGPVLVPAYQANMQAITAYLLNTFGAGKLILEEPPYIAPFSPNHTAQSTQLGKGYADALIRVAQVDTRRVFNTYGNQAYYANHQSDLGADQIHPTPPDANGQGGAPNGAARWAKNVQYADSSELRMEAIGVGGLWR